MKNYIIMTYNFLYFYAIYDRLEIMPFVFEGIKNLLNKLPTNVNLKILTIYSRDEDIKMARQYYQGYEFEYENLPIGKKYNKAFEYAEEIHKEYPWDYIVLNGCDNILLPAYFTKIIQPIQEGYHIISLSSLYMYDFYKDDLIVLKSNSQFGAGRATSYQMIQDSKGENILKTFTNKEELRSVQERLMRQEHRGLKTRSEYLKIVRKRVQEGYIDNIDPDRYYIYPDNVSRGLDGRSVSSMSRNTKRLNTKIGFIRSGRPMIIDIKTSDNINTFDKFRNIKYETFNKDSILKRFGIR